MEGTATISLDTLDELRAKAEEAETEKKRSDWFVKKLMNCYGFDTEAYDNFYSHAREGRDSYILYFREITPPYNARRTYFFNDS